VRYGLPGNLSKQEADREYRRRYWSRGVHVPSASDMRSGFRQMRGFWVFYVVLAAFILLYGHLVG